MSYDLFVASERAPELGALAATLEKWPEIARVGVSSEQLVVQVTTSAGGEPVFFIGAPARCEPADLDEMLVAYVKIPRWLTEITIPAHAGDAGIEIARKVATFIAKAASGAALDPQEDGVLWPQKPIRPPRAPSEPKQIDLVSVNWIVALPNDPAARAAKAPEVCTRFLDVLAKIQPAARPLRSGGSEPFQGRGIAAFEREWAEASSSPFGGMFSFSAKPPYLGGHINFAYPRQSLESPRNALSCIEVSMDIDATAFDDPRALPIEFAAIADGLAAMYGAAFHLRGYELVRARLMLPQGAESHPPLLGNGWIGLPPFAAWVVWMHRAYASQLTGLPAPIIDASFTRGAAFLFAQDLPDTPTSRLTGVP